MKWYFDESNVAKSVDIKMIRYGSQITRNINKKKIPPDVTTFNTIPNESE